MQPPPLPGQPAHRLKIPRGLIYWGDVKVAGTKFEGRQDILRKLADPNSPDQWMLVPNREPKNRYDSNAIAILAVKGRQKLHLGYLPRQVAASLKTCTKIGVVPRSIDPEGRYLYIDLYHSKIGGNGCLGCLTLIIASLVPITWLCLR